MLSTTQVGDLAGCSRFTVERACRDGKLTAAKVGRNWVIEDAEGKRWADEYRPHARTGKKASAGPGAEADPATATEEASG
jgi:excisionase family DNA binding protein